MQRAKAEVVSSTRGKRVNDVLIKFLRLGLMLCRIFYWLSRKKYSSELAEMDEDKDGFIKDSRNLIIMNKKSVNCDFHVFGLLCSNDRNSQ
jgi:hypothetical protein